MILTILVILFGGALSTWRIYEKLGREGYISLIPVYNYYVLFEEIYGSGKRIYRFLLPVVAYILFRIVAGAVDMTWSERETFAAVQTIIYAIIAIFLLITVLKLNFDLAKTFGKSRSFGFGLLLVNNVFTFLLAFSDAARIYYDKDGKAYSAELKSDNVISGLIRKIDNLLRFENNTKKEKQVLDLLSELSELHTKGIVSDELFEAKKEELLKKIA